MPERMGSPSSRKPFWSSPEKECRGRRGLAGKRQRSRTGLQRETKGERKKIEKAERKREGERRERWRAGRKGGLTESRTQTPPLSALSEDSRCGGDKGLCFLNTSLSLEPTSRCCNLPGQESGRWGAGGTVVEEDRRGHPPWLVGPRRESEPVPPEASPHQPQSGAV